MPVLLHNTSSSPFTGWTRCTVHSRPEHPAGRFAEGVDYVVGRPLGLIGHALDLHVTDLQPGQRMTLRFDNLVGKSERSEPLPLPPAAMSDPAGYFGVPSVLGVPLGLHSIEPDGAAWAVHLRARIGFLVADLWLRVYGDDPVIPGELAVTASDCSKPDLFVTLVEDLRLTCGSALVWVQGDSDTPLMRAGDRFADGQRRVWPIFIDHDGYAHGSKHHQTVARGIDTIGLLGVAEQGAFSPKRWVDSVAADCEASLWRWEPPWQVGVSANSAQTGDQADIGFHVGSESFYTGDLTCIAPRYLAALGQSKRPCHHLDHAGNVIDPATQSPRLIYWQSRAHWHTGVSPNRLGKLANLKASDCSGWWGADREHWLLNTVAAGYELTGSKALQDELRHQAFIFLGGETVEPGWATSSTDAARSAGYAGIVAAQLWRLLEDRALAERVKQRWIDRVEKVYVPRWGSSSMWDVRTTAGSQLAGSLDPSYTTFAMAYQQALGAAGVLIAGMVMEHQPSIRLGTAGAAAVVEEAWQRQTGDNGDTVYTAWEVLGLGGQRLYVNGVDVHRVPDWYRHAWMPLAPWAVLAALGNGGLLPPVAEKAHDILQTLRRESQGSWGFPLGRWIPPAGAL